MICDTFEKSDTYKKILDDVNHYSYEATYDDNTVEIKSSRLE